MSLQFQNQIKNQFQIVIRLLSPFEIEKKYRSTSKKLIYVGAFHNYALGQLLGFIGFNTKQIETIVAFEKNITQDILTHWYQCWRQNKYLPFSSTSTLDIPANQLYPLKLQLLIEYQPDLAGEGHETPHSIQIYPTFGSFSMSSAHPVDVSTPSLFKQNLDLLFLVKKDHIPAKVLLNFDSYALFINDCDEKCINQSGFAAIELAQLVADQSVSLVLMVPNSEQKAIKGTLFVRLLSCNMAAKPAVDWKLADKQQTLDQYIAQNRAFYQRYPASCHSIQNVTVFVYHNRLARLPGSIFDVFHIAPSHEEYYLNALLISAKRRYLYNDKWVWPGDTTTLDAIWTDALPRIQKLYIIMDMLALFVNYCTYQTDEVDHNKKRGTFSSWRRSKIELIESFDDIRCRYNGDCEDFSLEILKQAMEIKYNEFSSPIMKEVKALLQNFIIVSGLAAVSSAAISGASSSSQLNGHECAYAVPKYIFFEALQRSSAHHPLLSLYTEEEQHRGEAEEDIIYIIEGTGNLFPEPRTETRRWKEISKKIEMCRGQDKEEVMNNWINAFFYNPEQEDNFYKMIITLLTPEFFFEIGFPCFEFLVIQNGERGVWFKDLLKIKSNKDIAIVGCPCLEPDELFVALSLHENDLPPLSLQKPSIIPQEIIDITNQLNAMAPVENFQPQAFSFQIRFEEMTPLRIRSIERVLSQSKLTLHVDYEILHQGQFGKIVGGYNLSFYK